MGIVGWGRTGKYQKNTEFFMFIRKEEAYCETMTTKCGLIKKILKLKTYRKHKYKVFNKLAF